MDVKQSVEQQFTAAAARYVTSPVHRGGPDLEGLLAEAAPRGDERVLDLGCGPGHAALALAPKVAQLEAIDLSEAMLEHARALAEERGVENARFRAADAEALPYPDAHFDLVTSRHSAHHYPHPERAVAEVARVLVPGGRFLLVDAVAPEEAAADSYLNAIEVLRDPSHVRDHTVAQWSAFFSAAGLRPEPRAAWDLEIELAGWAERMQTPPAAMTQIRELFERAPAEVRAALRVDGRNATSFTLTIALLVGTKALH